MFMRIEGHARLLIVGALGAAALLAQDAPLSSESVNIKFPTDYGVTLVSSSMGESRRQARGAALVLDLHMSLTLRNTNAKNIRGLTLRVVSQEVAPMGKGSVEFSGLNVAPNEAFPVRINMQLMRPMQMAGAQLVDVNLDGVLFGDLSFAGPDLLHSRRVMTAREMEAQRDREYFKRVLAQSGTGGLQKAMLRTMAPQLNVRVRHGGPMVTEAALTAGERMATFAFLDMPDSPVRPVSGYAVVSGNEARGPHIEVTNRSGRQIQYVELGWLVRDASGQQYLAASVPAADPQLYLPPGKNASVVQDTTLTISRNDKPVNIQEMTGFVSLVQFADGKVWVPTRQNLESTALDKLLPPSAEEQRLSDIYRRKGLTALVDELKKY